MSVGFCVQHVLPPGFHRVLAAAHTTIQFNVSEEMSGNEHLLPKNGTNY